MKALYANQSDTAPTDDTETVAETGLPTWEGTLVVEDVPTGDGRQFAADSITWGDLPIPLRWNKEDSHGGIPQTVTVNVGRIDSIWRDDNRIMGSGVFNTAEDDGSRAYELVKGKFLTGVSIDADDIADADMELVWPESGADEDDDGEGNLFDMLFGSPELIIFHAGRIRAATLCDIPAFVEASIAVTGEAPVMLESVAASAVATHTTGTTDGTWDASTNEGRLPSPMPESMARDMYAWVDDGKVKDGNVTKSAGKFPHHMVGGGGKPGVANLSACSSAIGALNGARGGASIPDGDRRGAYDHLAKHLRDGGQEPPALQAIEDVHALVAHGGPDWAPPSAWFEDPHLSMATGLTVTDDGRVYGHAAQWGECHIGHPGACVTPPRESDHPYFMTGELVCADGARVSVGQITLGTGHAPLSMSGQHAAEHYDNTGVAVADVAVGEDSNGIWVAGAVRPEVPAARVRELRASGQLSGDWRRIGGKLRLIGLLAVNVPGFPVPKMTSRVLSGSQLALVAAGRSSISSGDLSDMYESRALRTIMTRLADRVHRNGA